jgi:hypothetical protein
MDSTEENDDDLMAALDAELATSDDSDHEGEHGREREGETDELQRQLERLSPSLDDGDAAAATPHSTLLSPEEFNQVQVRRTKAKREEERKKGERKGRQRERE